MIRCLYLLIKILSSTIYKPTHVTLCQDYIRPDGMNPNKIRQVNFKIKDFDQIISQNFTGNYYLISHYFFLISTTSAQDHRSSRTLVSELNNQLFVKEISIILIVRIYSYGQETWKQNRFSLWFHVTFPISFLD